MTAQHYDGIIIGAGQHGLVLGGLPGQGGLAGARSSSGG